MALKPKVILKSIIDLNQLKTNSKTHKSNEMND